MHESRRTRGIEHVVAVQRVRSAIARCQHVGLSAVHRPCVDCNKASTAGRQEPQDVPQPKRTCTGGRRCAPSPPPAESGSRRQARMADSRTSWQVQTCGLAAGTPCGGCARPDSTASAGITRTLQHRQASARATATDRLIDRHRSVSRGFVPQGSFDTWPQTGVARCISACSGRCPTTPNTPGRLNHLDRSKSFGVEVAERRSGIVWASVGQPMCICTKRPLKLPNIRSATNDSHSKSKTA